jgi:hypothetical protein
MLQIYVYVEGSDLQDVEELLLQSFQIFLENWHIDSARIINDKPDVIPDTEIDYYPDWNMGLNVEVPSLARQKIEELTAFLCELAGKSGCEFVIGFVKQKPDYVITEDLCFIGEKLKPDTVDFLADQFRPA